ncbi:MAG TPA: periplasmic heavy metal sensor [Bryobacteraceae bacterium]|nr:periplasmic heavy metal sensor [Bryobacteraceae bacterium]
MAFRILSTLLLAAGLLMAQGRGNRNSSAGEMGDVGMTRPEPLDQLAQMLKLNKDQKKDVKGIMDETEKEVTPLRENMVKSREQVGAAIEAGKSQAEIDQAVKSYADLEAQVSTVEAKAFSKIFSSLDADQKTNAQALVNSLMFMHEVFKRKNWNTQPSE